MEATQEKAQPQKAGGEVRIKVTSSQFRQNQKKLFDVVRAGGSVCITQGGRHLPAGAGRCGMRGGHPRVPREVGESQGGAGNGALHPI